jgi:hypothetical protein
MPALTPAAVLAAIPPHTTGILTQQLAVVLSVTKKELNPHLYAMQTANVVRVAFDAAGLNPRWSRVPPVSTAEIENCVLCLNESRDTLLHPCRHFGLCGACATQVANCPVCRTRIVSRERIYSA